jgi:cysteinylglycine-S-conjugate dipeptidase
MELRERIAGLMSQARDELAELVAVRSVADPRQFPPQECARAAQWVLDRFAGVGFTDLRLEGIADGSQAVFGARPGTDPAAPTVLLYAHYDVQPPLDEQAWRTPPFQLTEVDAAGTAGAPPTARATSSRTWSRCAPSATRCRST